MALGGKSLGGSLGKRSATRDLSDAHESATAKALGGRVQKGSGAGAYQKADVSTPELLIENKATAVAGGQPARSISVKAEWLEKVTKQAAAVGKDPALAFEIGGIEDPLVEKRWVAVPESVMQRLLEIARK